jgi:hypothetical protein
MDTFLPPTSKQLRLNSREALSPAHQCKEPSGLQQDLSLLGDAHREEQSTSTSQGAEEEEVQEESWR